MKIGPWLALLLTLPLVACIEDPGGGGDGDGAVEIDAVVGDTDPAGDTEPPEPDAEPEPDADVGPEPEPEPEPEPDAGPDPEPEPEPEPPIPPVESCADACDRHAACERLDIFGDYDACLDACDRASRRAPPEQWFDCLEFERNCGLLQICRLPEPPPLTCDEVCEAADDCGVELPFPDCVAECEAQAGGDPDAPTFALCGEAVVGGACNEGGLWSCLGDTVYTGCAARCETSIACNLERADGCLQACIGEGFVEDPLSRLRGTQRTRCVGLSSDDCERADACLNPQAPPAVVDRATFCDSWNRCAAQLGFPCDEAWAIGQDQPGFAECVVAQAANGCPPDPFLIFEQCFDNPVGQIGPGCAELCEARGVCDVLPEGQDQLTCLRECGAAVQGRDLEEGQRQRALFPCGIVETCAELTDCIETSSPLQACEAHCGALEGCGLAEPGCVEACDELFFRSRRGAFRDCVAAAADDCEAMGACDPGQPVGCIERCARLGACGNGDANCEAACDDASFGDPVLAGRITACTLAAPLCFEGLGAVSRCAGSPDVAGRACLGFCRSRVACDPDAVQPLVDCLVDCGEGFVGDEGLRFAEARECLDAADPVGACAALDGCIPAEPSVDCPAWCPPLDACGAVPAECEGACPADELSRLRTIEQVACLADADGCEAAEACYLDAAPPVPEPVDVVALCADYRACGFDDFLPCEFLVEEFARDDAALVCVRDLISPCPPDPFVLFDQCFEGGNQESEALRPCAELCEARGRCGELAGSIRGCTADCVDAARQVNNPIVELLTCKDALSCPELAECIRSNGPAGRCEAVCDSAVGCGAFPDADTCLDTCGNVLLGALVPPGYLDDVQTCLDGFADDPALCAAEGAGCFEIELGDCGAACDAIIGCGLDGGDPQECLIGCQQDQGAQPIIQCILQTLTPPDGCDIEAFERCAEAGIEPQPVDPEPFPDEPPPDPER